MDNQWVVLRPPFGDKNFFNSFCVQCVCREAVNGFGRHPDEAALPNDTGRFLHGSRFRCVQQKCLHCILTFLSMLVL